MMATGTLRLTGSFLRRDWTTHAALALWHVLPWYFVAAGFLDMSFALRMSWFALVMVAVYMLRAIARSQLLLVLPVNRREVWYATCLSAVVLPALGQALVGLILLAIVPYRGVPEITAAPTVELILLAGLYSAACLQLALFVVAGRSNRLAAAAALPLLGVLAWFTEHLLVSVSQLDPAGWAIAWLVAVVVIALVRMPTTHVAVTPERQRASPLRPGLPEIAVLNRVTGLSRIFVSYVPLVIVLVCSIMAGTLLLASWMDGRSALAETSEKLALFGGAPIADVGRDHDWFFPLMWGFAIGNVWTPFVRRLRTLPLTPAHLNAIFLVAPLIGWVVAWMMFLALYALVVGPVVTPRLDVWLGLSGTSALASVISLRWRPYFFGMLGMLFVYGVWSVISIGLIVARPADLGTLMFIVGICFHGAAVMLNGHTLRHATSGSAAYQSVPKLFDTAKEV
jgi:hypothetical protein